MITLTEEKFANLVFEIGRLLNMKVIRKGHPVADTLNSIWVHHTKQEFNARDVSLGNITLLMKNLQRIESYDKQLLHHFQKNMKKPTKENYYGLRLEIQIASNLIKNQIKFKKSESPDFIIFYNNSKIFVECTSTHVRKIMPNPAYKIVSAITKKSQKPYCNELTALAIDITNLIFSSKHNVYVSGKYLKQEILKVLSSSKFGSILLEFYILDKKKGVYSQNYHRIDNKNIDTKLKQFLDSNYPMGKVWKRNNIILKQG